jgi:hypothetical protein
LPEPIVSFDVIDWQQPWLAPFKDTGQQLLRSGDWLLAANRIACQQDLRTTSNHRVVFVPQHTLAADIAYEAHIHASGEVPTRDNLHDFFNTLAWLHFPQIKKTLNALHAASQLEAAKTSGTVGTLGTRGRARDAATLFDENAALFICSDPQSAEALREHQWIHLLQHSSETFFSKTAVVLFGHALIEKLVRPYKAITAHVWITMVEPNWFERTPAQRIDALDHGVAEAISKGFSSADFAHLPVLGVPGWWPQQDEDFYEDPAVFRALRNTPAKS